jgi:hypothetical protein
VQLDTIPCYFARPCPPPLPSPPPPSTPRPARPAFPNGSMGSGTSPEISRGAGAATPARCSAGSMRCSGTSPATIPSSCCDASIPNASPPAPRTRNFSGSTTPSRPQPNAIGQPLGPGSRPPIRNPWTGRSPTSAPSSGSTPRCRSTPGASGFSPATTVRPRRTSACRSWASGCSTPRATRTSGCGSTAGRKTPKSASTWRRCRYNRCAARGRGGGGGPRPLPRDGAGIRTLRRGWGLARHRGPRADLPLGHGPRAE